MMRDEYVEDQFYFCSEILRHEHKKELAVALENINGVDIVYKSSSTPFYLQKIGLIEIIDTEIDQPDTDLYQSPAMKWLARNNKVTAKGLFVITFDIKKVDEYVERMINKNFPDPDNEEEQGIKKSLKAHSEDIKSSGYLIFDKTNERIKIGRLESGQFRLLKQLEPFGIWFSLDHVYDGIKSVSESGSYDIFDPKQRRIKQKKKVDNLVGELQREDKLKGRIKVEYSPDRSKVRLIFS